MALIVYIHCHRVYVTTDDRRATPRPLNSTDQLAFLMRLRAELFDVLSSKLESHPASLSVWLWLVGWSYIRQWVTSTNAIKLTYPLNVRALRGSKVSDGVLPERVMTTYRHPLSIVWSAIVAVTNWLVSGRSTTATSYTWPLPGAGRFSSHSFSPADYSSYGRSTASEDRWHVAIVIHFVTGRRLTASETALSHCIVRLMLTFSPALIYFTAALSAN